VAQSVRPTLDPVSQEYALSPETRTFEARLDPGLAVTSVVVFVVIGYFGVDRILGIDEAVKRWARGWVEARAAAKRAQVMDERQRLLERYEGGEFGGGEGGPGPGPGGDGDGDGDGDGAPGGGRVDAEG